MISFKKLKFDANTQISLLIFFLVGSGITNSLAFWYFACEYKKFLESPLTTLFCSLIFTAFLTLAVQLFIRVNRIQKTSIQRLNIENRLRRSEQTFSVALETAPVGMIMVDEHGTIEFANPWTHKIFGYETGELLGKNIDILVPSRARKAHVHFRNLFANSATPRVMSSRLDLKGEKKDNTEFPVDIGLTPFRAPDGLHVMCAVVDLTERNQSTRIIKETSDELLRSNRELEQFAYITSHDLQAPLRHISSFTELLSQKLKLETDLQI